MPGSHCQLQERVPASCTTMSFTLEKLPPGKEGRQFLGRLMPAAHVATGTRPQPCCSDLPLLSPKLRAMPPAAGAQGLLPFHSQNLNVHTLSKKFCKIVLCVARASTCF